MDDGSKCTVHGRVCSECASREGCGVFWYDGIWGRFSGTEYRNYKIIGIYIIYISNINTCDSIIDPYEGSPNSSLRLLYVLSCVFSTGTVLSSTWTVSFAMIVQAAGLSVLH